MSVALREVLASFGFEIDKNGALPRADKQVSEFGKKLMSIGAAATGAFAGVFAVDRIVSFSNDMIKAADIVGDTSDQLGISARQLQEWSYAAKLSGAETEDFTAAVQRLGAHLADAAAGKGNADVFRKLGVSLKDARGQLRSTGDVFDDVAMAIGGLSNPTEQAGIASDLFGKSYARLLPLFRRGKAGMAELRQEFANLGGGFSADFVKQSSDFEDNLDRLKVSGMGFASEVLGPLLPMLSDLAKGAIAFVRSLTAKSNGSSVITDVAHSVGNIFKGFVAINNKSSVFSHLLDGAGEALQFLLRGFYEVEDAVVFLAGGKSLIGKNLDKVFGAGSQDKVRGYFNEIISWIGQVDFKGIVNGIAKVIDGVESVRNSFVLKFAVGAIKAIGDIGFALLALPGQVTSAFTGMWNGILDGAADAIARIGAAITKLPGAKELGLSITASSFDVRDHKLQPVTGAGPLAPAAPPPAAAGGNAAAAQAQADAFLAFAHAKRATAYAPAAPNVTTNNNVSAPISTTVNVTVEGGASGPDVGNRVGKVAGKAVEAINMRAVKNALVPTPR